jgi:LysR family hydrogen peroxide-inducible transcriptional activator
MTFNLRTCRASILSLDPRHHLHGIVEQICNDLGAELLRDYEGSSLDSLCQMTGSGLGISVMPELYLRSEVGGRNVVKRLNVAGWTSYRSIAAVWRRGAAFTEHFAKIADLIGSEARRTLNETRPSFSQLQLK